MVTPTPDLSSQARSQKWIRPLRLEAGNILLHPTDPTRLYLVDYGCSRAITSSIQISSNTPSYHVVGTLPYASLNMHYGIRKLHSRGLLVHLLLKGP